MLRKSLSLARTNLKEGKKRKPSSKRPFLAGGGDGGNNRYFFSRGLSQKRAQMTVFSPRYSCSPSS